MIELIEVNKDNWQACIALPTSDAHRFVASNLYSIAEAQFYPKAHAYGVYADGQLVGFTMYGLGEDDETMLWIDRLMIAEPFLRQGYGLDVLEKIIEEARTLGVSRIGLSTEPENHAAKQAFEKAGFEAAGLKDGDEDIYHFTLRGVADAH